MNQHQNKLETTINQEIEAVKQEVTRVWQLVDGNGE